MAEPPERVNLFIRVQARRKPELNASLELEGYPCQKWPSPCGLKQVSQTHRTMFSNERRPAIAGV